MAIKFKTLCAIGALLLCSNNALAMPDNSRDQSSRDNMANVGSSDKSYIVLLCDYCQNKNTPISISDLTFQYEKNNKGCFNCIAIINGETFDKNLSCGTKIAAKNEIARYVLDELVKRDGHPQATERKNNIKLLYDYCRDENTKINPSDLTFEYEMNNKGCFNCIATINGETFDKNLSCRTKRAAKNEIARYVLDELVKRDGYPQATNLSLDDSDSESSSDNGVSGIFEDAEKEVSKKESIETQAKVSMINAIAIGDTVKIRALIEQNPFLVDARLGNKSMHEWAEFVKKPNIAQLLTNFREEQVLVLNIYEKIKGTEISDKLGIQEENIIQNIKQKKNELLRFAVETSNLDLVDLLIQISADVNGEDGEGYTPLFYTRNVEVAEKLIKHGADINHKSGDNRTLLTNNIANSSGEIEPEEKKLPWVRFVVRRIAKDKINEPTDLGNTPLHIASKFNYSKIVQMLIEAGADLNVKNKKGMTPLMRASQYDSKEVAEVLLPKSTPEEIGQALQVAIEYESKKVIDVIVDEVDFSKEQLKTIFKSIAINQ